MKTVVLSIIRFTEVLVNFLSGLPIVGKILQLTLKYANISNPAELLIFLVLLGLVTLIPGPFNVPFAIAYGKGKSMIKKRFSK